MKVLLDECIDWRLSRDLTGHDVKTARQMGWSSIKNDELLALAAAEFDVFVTVDRNLSFQQNLIALPIAVVVLQSKSNRLADLRVLVPDLLKAFGTVQRGMAIFVGA
jgi:predicted nuclease of predicted toxin-antitoxin system